jgi:hypothetical protein
LPELDVSPAFEFDDEEEPAVESEAIASDEAPAAESA